MTLFVTSHPRLGSRVDGKPLKVGDQVPDSWLLGSTSGHGKDSAAASLTHLLRLKGRHFHRLSVFSRKAPPPTPRYNRVGLRQQAWSEMCLDWDRS